MQFGEYNRLVQLDCTRSDVSEKRHFCWRSELRLDKVNRLHQIKDSEWQGMLIDFFGDDVEDRSIYKVLVEKCEVRMFCAFR